LEEEGIAAHYNVLEAFPGFAAAVIIALATNVNETLVAKLAVIFVTLRIAYHFVYLTNIAAWLRSTIWVASWFVVLSLFLLPFYPTLYATPPAKFVGEDISRLFNNLIKQSGLKL